MAEGIFKQGVKKMSQKFKLSDDQNTLIVVSGEFEGQYEATGQDGCASCSFLINEVCELKTFSTCAWGYRKDSESIIWIKKETEMTEAPAPAPVEARAHAELIKQWASDKSLKVFVWYKNAWGDISEPAWYKSENYAVGHEKPTEPPVKMVKYDGGSIEFPEPARVELERDTNYWAVTIYGADPEYWTDHSFDIELLENGLIQPTKEGAEKQSEALVELLKNHAQKWGWNEYI